MKAQKSLLWRVSWRRRALYILWLALWGMGSGDIASAAIDPITGAEPAEGYGASVTGGHGKPEVIATTFSELAALRTRSNIYIKVRGNLSSTTQYTIFTGSNVTLDGEGAATVFGNRTQGQLLLEFWGKNVVIKNIRFRNAGDNLGFKSPADGILVSHVSTTGATDDGISIAYGTQNVTVQYTFFCGNTRSCFIKYGARDGSHPYVQNVSLHHNWFKGQWIRGPEIHSARNVDVRNQLGENWWSWGGPRFEYYATGNCINSTFVMTGVTPGKTDASHYTYNNGGPAYFAGNAYRGASGRSGNSSTEIPCAPVTTESASASEANIRANAGCLPRDAIDLAYMAATSWPSLGDTRPWIIEPTEAGPTATVTGPPSPTTSIPIVFTINFNKSVTGLTGAGITVTNGTKGTLTGSGAGLYTLPVTPAGPGPVTCKVNAGAAQDSGGAGNVESNTLAIIFEAPELPEDFSTWSSRLPLRFSGFSGSDPLTSFPVLVRLDAALFPPENFEPGGADLRFTDAAQIPLPYEIETWNRDGESCAWVVVPRIASSDDYIWMLWGKPGVLSRARPNRVWTNGSLGVWHLDSDLTDATSAVRHAANHGATTEEGLIGLAAGFDGADYISLPPAGSSTAGSMSVWLKTSTNFSTLGHVFYLRGPGATTSAGGNPGDGYGAQHEIHLNFVENANTLRFFMEGGAAAGNVEDVYLTTSDAYNNGDWHHVAATWQKPGTCNLYLNGELAATTEHIGVNFDITQFAALGKPETDTRYFTGLLDEARLESAVRSPDWIRACYLNQKKNSIFVEYGAGAPMAVVSGPPSPTAVAPILFTILFTKPVTGLTDAGITVTNGIKGALTGSGAGPYMLPVTPLEVGAVTCQVNLGAAQDEDTNENLPSNVLSIWYGESETGENLSTWAHRKILRFAGFSGSDPLINFPVLVRLDAVQFPPAEFEPGGADLRFTDSEGTPLPYEIESWNPEGESVIWVLAPRIISSNDFINMYWGKPGAPAAAQPGEVWSNGFLAAWHLGSGLQDSTAAARHATNNGTAPENGIIATGARFDGAQYIALPASDGSSEAGSLSVWIKTSADFETLAHVFYMRGPGGTGAGLGDGLGGQNELHVNFQTTETLRFFLEGTLVGETPATLNDVIITTANSYADGQWHHVAATWEKPGACNLYVNGELKVSAPHTGTVFNFSTFAALGKPEGNLRYYTGLMDEARLENAVRSADWIRACYLNQKQDSTFIQYSNYSPPATVWEWNRY